MSRNIVFEGWLTKSPPTKRIWRAKWRRRWFALRQSGELPGQYFLDYYADRNYRRLKGTINLDLCEQVDAGLRMEKSGNSSLGPRLRGSVFSVRTQSRTYHLEADCEDEMDKWVKTICQVCNLSSSEDNDNREMEVYQPAATAELFSPPRARSPSPSPYMPISECSSGSKSRDEGETSFTVKSQPRKGNRCRPCVDISENESNLSEEEWDWTVAKSFTKLKIRNNDLGPVRYPGPPVPPRPWSTLSKNKNARSEIATVSSSKIEVPVEVYANENACSIRKPCCHPTSHAYDSVPARPQRRYQGAMAMMGDHTYANLGRRPPAVDRALKPRFESDDDNKEHVLQYLELDLNCLSSTSDMSKQENPIRVHSRLERYKRDEECEYNTVDFIKTEAFNLTRQDIEASRMQQCIMNH